VGAEAPKTLIAAIALFNKEFSGAIAFKGFFAYFRCCALALCAFSKKVGSAN